MKVEIVEKKGNNLTFILRDSTFTFANALRRIIVSEVPTMAIDELKIVENSSALYDEMLALRLGLVPLKTDLKLYALPNECSCKGEGCSNCTCSLTLNVNGTPEGFSVFSSELKSNDRNIVPAFDKIPIVYLLSHHRVELEAVARLGCGASHVKFKPGNVGYKHVPIITVDISKNVDWKKVIEACPVDALTLNKRVPVLKTEHDCTLCKACVDACPEKGAITVGKKLNDFVFNVESFGQLPPEEMVLKAVEILEDKTKEFVDKVDKIK